MTAGADVPAPGTLVGRYVVDAPIGSGAMGVVVRAYDPELDRTVALKLLRTSDPAERASANARLVREAQAMARLSHPNVVRVHDVGVVDDRVFVALDLITGGTLREWLATPRRLGEILDVLDAAGRGLAAAHEIGLVHRDFKPDNVLVDTTGRAYVTDFGLVRVGPPTRRLVPVPRPTPESIRPPISRGTTDEVTGVGTILGTPAYMAPEQLEGGDVDERSDQFAFCVTLYEAVYGARPFAGATVDRLASAVLRSELAPMPVGRDVPSWLRRVLLRGLARHPGDRFESMHALLHAVRGGARRRRLVAWIGGSTVAAAAAIGVGSWTQRAPCTDAARDTATIVDMSQRDLEALLATRGFDATVAQEARRSAAAWLADWSATDDAMCRVALERGERSATALASTRRCLVGAHAELAALVELAATDGVTATRLVRALARLPDPTVCRDVVAAESDPDDASVRSEVARLRAARALGVTIPAIHPADGGLVAFEQALTVAARDPVAAPAALQGALLEAERIGSASARARGWIARVLYLAGHDGALAEVARSAGLAHAAIARAGDDAGWHADVDLAHGEALLAAERTAEAIELLHRTAQRRAERHGADHLALADAGLALARAHGLRGEHDRALAEQLRALALVEARLGAAHPTAATIRVALADTLARMGDTEAAAGQRARGLAALGIGGER